MVGISKIVAANNLLGMINIGGLAAEGCVGIIDCSEHTADIKKTVPASIWKCVTAHDVVQAVDPASQSGCRAWKIDCREGVIAEYSKLLCLCYWARGPKWSETGDQQNRCKQCHGESQGDLKRQTAYGVIVFLFHLRSVCSVESPEFRLKRDIYFALLREHWLDWLAT